MLFKNIFCAVFFLVQFAQANEYIVKFKPNQRSASLKLLLEKNFKINDHISQLDMYVVESGSNSQHIDSLKNNDSVIYVEKNIQLFLTDTTPNDKKFNNQWHHRKINSTKAWDVTKGSTQVIVAVVDTGMSLVHEDLKNQLWYNVKEIAANGIDDDQNGFIDDIAGWDFANNDNNAYDDQSHGSHCAGIIGAESNNQIGVTGVAWNVKLMPLKFITSSGSGSEVNAIKAILYAADNGAHIISASWGSPEPVQALSDAIAYAATKNVLFVAAAGNDKTNSDRKPFYPAGYKLPNVISVAASGGSNNRADFTNFGATAVHIAAPGVDIYSTSMKQSYETKSGTSMAAPVVSGVATLILALQKNMSVVDLRNAVLNAVLEVGSWKNSVATSGIIQADLAVNQLQMGPQLWPKKLRLKVGDRTTLTAYQITQPIWESANLQIVQTDTNGHIVGISPGLTQINVIDDSGLRHLANIEVVKK